MYWFYNVCLVAYWFFQVPVLLYRLIFEDGFYDRLKQSAGIMPTPTLEQIAYHNAIWIHAASVGEVVAASPIVRELKKRYPKENGRCIRRYCYRSPNGAKDHARGGRPYIFSF